MKTELGPVNGWRLPPPAIGAFNAIVRPAAGCGRALFIEATDGRD